MCNSSSVSCVTASSRSVGAQETRARRVQTDRKVNPEILEAHRVTPARKVIQALQVPMARTVPMAQTEPMEPTG